MGGGLPFAIPAIFGLELELPEGLPGGGWILNATLAADGAVASTIAPKRPRSTETHRLVFSGTVR